MSGFGLLTAFWGLLALFLLGLAFRAWRTRNSAQLNVLPAPPAIPIAFTGTRFENLHYVATVFADDPLVRVTAHGLAMRGRCDLEIGAVGLAVQRKGEVPFFVSPAAVSDVAKRSVALGRAVEKDGLAVISWWLGSTRVESVFRFPKAADHEAFNALAMKFLLKEEQQ